MLLSSSSRQRHTLKRISYSHHSCFQLPAVVSNHLQFFKPPITTNFRLVITLSTTQTDIGELHNSDATYWVNSMGGYDWLEMECSIAAT